MHRAALFLVALLTCSIVRAEIRSADLKRCPDGHSTLKDIPIHYGLSTLDSKEIERHVKNLDYVMAGCEIAPDSPTVQPTCTTCRLAYDSAGNAWSRRSADIRTFRRPFSAAALSFPVLRHPRKVEYEQWVHADRVVSEEIVYTASTDHPELKSQINQWLKRNGIKATYTEPKEPRIVRQWTAPGLSIRFSYEPGKLFVWLTHDLQPRKT